MQKKQQRVNISLLTESFGTAEKSTMKLLSIVSFPPPHFQVDMLGKQSTLILSAMYY